MKNILIGVLLFQGIIAHGQNKLNIVPMPAEVKMGAANKFFTISKSTILQIDDSKSSQTYLAWYLQKNIMDKYGFDLPIRPSCPGANKIYQCLQFKRYLYWYYNYG